jgi:hypothetical protein
MVLVALIAILLGVGVTLGIAQARADHEQYSAPALASSPWWPHMSDAMDVMYGRSQISSYVGVLMRDASYPGFNVTDGRRHTWTPPTTHACGTLRVWVFGGSTLFGLGQRDGHTIPSELARLAWSEGIRLQVENWGVPADTRWMEVRRLELALAEGEPAPDLAVFYDGANDYRIQANMNSIGRGGQRLFANDLDGDALRGIEDSERFQASLMQLTRGGPKLTPEKYTVLPPEAVGDFAARGYAAAADLAEPVLRAHGIRAAWFYQPTRVTRSEPLASERPPPPQDNRDERVLERTFRSHLRPDDIDLSGAMDGTRQPVYYDVMHTNELGARVVAAAMFDHLRPQLLSLLASKGLAPCR